MAMVTRMTTGIRTATPMTTEQLHVDPALILHRWLSPAYPVGAFAYSHGIEAAVADGWITDTPTAEAWIRDILDHGAGHNDALLLAAAWHAAPQDLPEIAELALALAPSASRRLETSAQGAAFAATTAEIHGIDLPAMPYPVALGRAARLMDLPLDMLLRLSLLAFASTLTSAAVRLVPLGQTDGQRILSGLEPLCQTLAQRAETGDLEGLGARAILSDIAAMRQEALTTRLFRS
ncbi:Urease accessory protein UreF [Pseudooceanicola algae]|uniref:Urease accessory protein UreF n=2 Tax=Pseudooceanicola algae TaxID=1537215 RepID=A0A418SEU8_9RHOB|nr:Urease accessory protein UreF [Pseudooceanicola algae]